MYTVHTTPVACCVKEKTLVNMEDLQTTSNSWGNLQKMLSWSFILYSTV